MLCWVCCARWGAQEDYLTAFVFVIHAQPDERQWDSDAQGSVASALGGIKGGAALSLYINGVRDCPMLSSARRNAGCPGADAFLDNLR